MALYDNYQGAEARLRFDESNQIPRYAAPSDYAQTPNGMTGELSPNFLGGDVDPSTGNVVPGTRQRAAKGMKVTPYGTQQAAPAPAAPSSLLSTI